MPAGAGGLVWKAPLLISRMVAILSFSLSFPLSRFLSLSFSLFSLFIPSLFPSVYPPPRIPYPYDTPYGSPSFHFAQAAIYFLDRTCRQQLYDVGGLVRRLRARFLRCSGSSDGAVRFETQSESDRCVPDPHLPCEAFFVRLPTGRLSRSPDHIASLMMGSKFGCEADGCPACALLAQPHTHPPPPPATTRILLLQPG